MYKHAKTVEVQVNREQLFEEALDRFEEAVREETQAVSARDARTANQCTDRKLRLRQAVIMYVAELQKEAE